MIDTKITTLSHDNIGKSKLLIVNHTSITVKNGGSTTQQRAYVWANSDLEGYKFNDSGVSFWRIKSFLAKD
jgi:hypothetical protein